MPPQYLQYLPALMYAGLAGTALALLVATGQNRWSPRVFFLLALRLAIGWHFLFEGLHKVHSHLHGPSESARPFSSEPYFKVAPGPLGAQMRKSFGDPVAFAAERVKAAEDIKPADFDKLSAEEQAKRCPAPVAAALDDMVTKAEAAEKEAAEKAVKTADADAAKADKAKADAEKAKAKAEEAKRDAEKRRDALGAAAPDVKTPTKKAEKTPDASKSDKSKTDADKKTKAKDGKDEEAKKDAEKGSDADETAGKTPAGKGSAVKQPTAKDAAAKEAAEKAVKAAAADLAKAQKDWTDAEAAKAKAGGAKKDAEKRRESSSAAAKDLVTAAKAKYARWVYGVEGRDTKLKSTTGEAWFTAPQRLEYLDWLRGQLADAQTRFSAGIGNGTGTDAKRMAEYRGDLIAAEAALVKDANDFVAELQKDLNGGKAPEAAPAPRSLGQTMDLVTMWFLVAVGACLMGGLLTRVMCVLGTGFLVMTYLAHPPFPWYPLPPNTEGNPVFINKNVIEAIALLAVASFPTGRWLGLDALLSKVFCRTPKDNSPTA